MFPFGDPGALHETLTDLLEIALVLGLIYSDPAGTESNKNKIVKRTSHSPKILCEF